MKKKIITLLTTICIFGSLMACGKEETSISNSSTNSNETMENVEDTEDTDNTDNVNDEVVEEVETNTVTLKWEVKEQDLPILPNLEIIEKPFNDKYNTKVVKTPFDMDIDTIFNNLKENEFLNNSYKEIIIGKEETSYGTNYNDNTHRQKYLVSDILSANLLTNPDNSLDGDKDFKLSFYQNSEKYENIYQIQLNLYNLPVTDTLQTDLASVVTEIFGDYSDTLLYTKDLDGECFSKYTDFYNYNNFGLAERIGAGEDSYFVIRNIKESDTEGCFDITFAIGVNYCSNDPAYEYYEGNIVSNYNSLPFTFSDLFSEEFGETNVNDFQTFGNKAFKVTHPGYTESSLNNWEIYTYKNESNQEKIYMSFDIKTRATGDYYFYTPSLSYTITITRQDDVIQTMDVHISSLLHHATDEEYNKEVIFEQMKDFIKTILPDVDFTDYIYTEKEIPFYEKEITANILGVELNGTSTISPKANETCDGIIDLKYSVLN